MSKFQSATIAFILAVVLTLAALCPLTQSTKAAPPKRVPPNQPILPIVPNPFVLTVIKWRAVDSETGQQIGWIYDCDKGSWFESPQGNLITLVKPPSAFAPLPRSNIYGLP